MKTKTDYKSILIEINILTIAIAIIAVAVYFTVPSHTSISSMSGLGIVLSNFETYAIIRQHDDFNVVY